MLHFSLCRTGIFTFNFWVSCQKGPLQALCPAPWGGAHRKALYQSCWCESSLLEQAHLPESFVVSNTQFCVCHPASIVVFRPPQLFTDRLEKNTHALESVFRTHLLGLLLLLSTLLVCDTGPCNVKNDVLVVVVKKFQRCSCMAKTGWRPCYKYHISTGKAFRALCPL